MDSTDSNLVGRRFGGFEIVAPLGHGGMGAVYRALDTKLGRDVAIKVLPTIFASDPERLARFEREARLLATLNHQSIGSIYGLEQIEGFPALVLELVEGPTLEDRIAQGPIPIGEALSIGRQIADALDAAHEKGIVHRDLKPANIKIAAGGAVKVLDFGLAKLVARADVAPGFGSPDPSQSPTVTIGGTGGSVILGTAAYMSPEQARGQAVDKRIDIWAFGCVLYEMLTGRVAFRGATVSDTIAAIIERNPDWAALPATTPAVVRRLTQRCLEKDSKRRLHDIADARIDLDDALVEMSTAPTRLRDRPVTRPRLRWMLPVAGLGVAAFLSLQYFKQPRVDDRPVRLSIPLPESVALQGYAVSPDGRTFAFAATDATGTFLWVRALETSVARVLPGTDGASRPFWSPDSRFVGFFADGKLKKTDIGGGPPETLCDAPNPRGGTWGQAGFIIFSPNAGLNGLYRVAVSGGQATAATKREGAGSQRWPHFLPDGHHFLYLALYPQTGAIEVGSVDSMETKPVMSSLAEAAYAPPGYLVFARDTTLVAQRFDAGALEMTGEPFPVAEQVSVGPERGQGNFSLSDNGTLVFLNAASTQDRLVWFDRRGNEIGSIDPSGNFREAELSPDETRMAIEVNDPQTQAQDLWLLDVKRGTRSRLTFEPISDYSPIWSPDGASIAYTSNRGGIPDLYQLAVAGVPNDMALAKTTSRKSATDWSRDGQFIVYTNEDSKTKADLWVLPLGGDKRPFPYLASPFNEGSGRLSPDGQWMAYVSDESGRDEVYVQPFPATGRKLQVSIQGGSRPQWGRDGSELFFVAADETLMAVRVRPGSVMEADSPTRLFTMHLSVWTGKNDYMYARNGYTVAADGQRVLVHVMRDLKVAPLTVVLNWTALLRDGASAGK